MTQAPQPAPAGDSGESGESGDLFDYQSFRNRIGFVLRGVRRHRSATVLTFLGVLAVGSVFTALYPRTYRAEAKLLANRSQIIRSLGNPRSSGLPAEDPTRAAEETIFAHDNLVSMIKQTKLIEKFRETRAPILRLKDAAVRLVAGPMSDEDELDTMVGLLEKRLKVVTDSQTVTVSIDWPDAKMAYQLVETAQQNFLESRHVNEMTAISAALSILELHAGNVQKQVDEALHELERVRELRRKGSPSPAPAGPRLEGARSVPAVTAPTRLEPTATQAANEQELAQLKFLLQSKKRARGDLEDFRARRLSELRAELAEQKVMYADQHPIVRDTLQRIAAMDQDSPQLVQVKEDIMDLLAEYRRKGGQDPDSLAEPRRRSPIRTLGGQAQAAMTASELSDDPLVEFSRNSLRVVSAKYEELMMRIDAARIEQDTARAAFKYRYSVVRPATVPKKVLTPNVPMLLVGSLLLALGCALFTGALLDVWRGRLVEAWQVEARLDLPVISEVTTP